MERWSLHACLLFTGLLCHAGSRAQSNFYEEEPKTFTGGIVVGTNFTQVDGDTYYGFYKVGLNAGGIVTVRFSESFGASMELLYAQKGVRGVNVLESPYVGTYVEKYYLNLNYVEVPILLHIKPSKLCVWQRQLDIEAGISYARLINFKEWAEADQPVLIDPNINYFKTSDLDYVLGLSFKAYKNIFINTRYQYSIFTIRDPTRIPVGYGYGTTGQYNILVRSGSFIYLSSIDSPFAFR